MTCVFNRPRLRHRVASTGRLLVRTGVAYTLFGPNYSQVASLDEVDTMIRAALFGVTSPLRRRHHAA